MVMVLESGERAGDPWEGVDEAALSRAVRAQAGRSVAGVDDMASRLLVEVSEAVPAAAPGRRPGAPPVSTR